MLGAVTDVDLNLLRVFMTVVRCRGFAAAQSVLNVSMASISMQMKQLEVRLGVCLCHRGRSGFWLTEEGKQVHEACQALFRSLDEFRSSVAQSSSRYAARLHISVIDNSVFNPGLRLYDAVRRLKEQDKHVEVVLYVVSPNEVEQMVFDGSCDLGIGFFPARRQGLEYHPLFTSNMNLYCGLHHPLFKRAPHDVSLDEVLAQEHAARGYVSNAQLSTFEKRFLVAASSFTVEGLVTLVLSGKYTAFLPEHYARNWTVSDTIRPILPDVIGYTSLYEIISKREKAQNHLLSSFVRHLKATHAPVDSQQFRIGTSI